jgi:hypothetical protein
MPVRILKPLEKHEKVYLTFYLYGIPENINGKVYYKMYLGQLTSLLTDTFKYRIDVRKWMLRRVASGDVKEKFEVDPNTGRLKRRWFLLEEKDIMKVINKMLQEKKIEIT